MSVSVDKSVIARLMKDGQKFEILVDPDRALEFRHGKEVPLDDLVATPDVYHDQGKGEKVDSATLNKIFSTNDIAKIAEKIIKDGDVQLTTEQRHKMMEDLTKRVSYMIAREGVNPQTNVPHPQDRILRAMEEAKVRLVLGKRAEEQVEDVLKAIQRIVPISMEKIKVSVNIPAQYSGQASGMIHRFGKPVKESWGGDGSYSCQMELSGGTKADLIDKISSMTHGQAEIKDIK
jgi:ribosome maturation protein SDO1